MAPLPFTSKLCSNVPALVTTKRTFPGGTVMSAGVRANSLSATSTVGISAPAATLEERLLTLTAIPAMTSATIATAVEKYREKLRR